MRPCAFAFFCGFEPQKVLLRQRVSSCYPPIGTPVMPRARASSPRGTFFRVRKLRP